MPAAGAATAAAERTPDAAADAAPPDASPGLVLEFALDPGALPRLSRHPALAAARAARRPRPLPESLVWYDTPEGALAARGLALEVPQRGPARHVLLFGDAAEAWLPGTPAPHRPAEGPPEAAGMAAIAAFDGRRGSLPVGGVALTLLAGRLRAVTAERPVARVTLSGAPAAVLALARRLAADLPLLPAGAALAEEGRALARGEPPRPRRRGAPDPGAAATVEEALLAAIGHLLEVLLHQAPLCRAGAGPEGVHQARVALRRLRSVLKVFRPAAGCPALRCFDDGLRDLARLLGTARDLDVFLLGLGARAAAAFPADRRMAQLLRVAEARRAAAYAALRAALEAPGFRALALDGIALLTERPWREAAAAAPEQAEILAEAPAAFGARVLDKRWHRLCAEGESIHQLDATGLHELRLTAKRLRYAAELFAPLWPGKAQRRLLKRLAALQETLGLANDAAVAGEIVAGFGSGAPAWAVGAVEGYARARAAGARRKGIEAWEYLMVAKPFWTDL